MRLSIEDLADISTGYQPRGKLEPSCEGTHLAIQAKDIDNEGGHILNSKGLDRVTPTRAAPHIVRNGDILFLARGRKRFATLVDGLPATPDTIAIYYFLILRVKSTAVNPSFLAWIINEADAQSYLNSVAVHTGLPFVTKQAFSSLEIQLPSLETQNSISHLHQLALQERKLLRALEQKRSEHLRSICLSLYNKDI